MPRQKLIHSKFTNFNIECVVHHHYDLFHYWYIYAFSILSLHGILFLNYHYYQLQMVQMLTFFYTLSSHVYPVESMNMIPLMYTCYLPVNSDQNEEVHETRKKKEKH